MILKKVLLIYIKDIKEEFRKINNLLSMIVFALLQVFIFSFSLNLTDVEGIKVYPSFIWIIILFSSTLGLARIFSKEKEENVIDALILAASERVSIYFGKFLASLTLLVIVEIIVIPLFLIFVDYRGDINFYLFLSGLIFGSSGLTLVGNLLNAIIFQIQENSLLLPVLYFPITIPVLNAVIQITSIAFIGSGNWQLWFYFLIFYNLIFIIVPLLLFDSILEV